MNGQTEPDLLDRLLEQPALIADSGFSDRVQSRLRRPLFTRSTVFLVIGGAWLFLASLGGSPGFFTDSSGALVDAIAWIGAWVAWVGSLSVSEPGQAATGLPGVLVILPVLGLLLFQLVSQSDY